MSEPRAPSLHRQAAAACGALFSIGIVLGDDTINRAGEPPTPLERGGDSLGRVEAYLNSASEASASGSYWVGRGVGTLALIALLVFSAHVARAIRVHESETGMLSGVALGAGSTATAMGLVSCAAQFAVVSRAAEGIDREVARALLDLSGVTFVMMWLPIGVFMAAVAAAGRRHDLLPRWLTIATAVLAVALAAGLAAMPLSNVGFVAIVLGFLWFVAASVVLVRRAVRPHSRPS